MAIRRWRVQAHFPPHATLTIEVVAGSWAAALGRASRELKRMPELKKRRIKACSMVLQLIGSVAGSIADASAEQVAASPQQAALPQMAAQADVGATAPPEHTAEARQATGEDGSSSS